MPPLCNNPVANLMAKFTVCREWYGPQGMLFVWGKRQTVNGKPAC